MLVFDSGALIALLRFEPGASTARRLIRLHRGQSVIHAVNLCEIYYGFSRALNQETAERAVDFITRAGIQTRQDMDSAFWKDVGAIKARHRLSLADAFAVATARRLTAPLVSTDHHELDAVHAAGICRVLFLR